MTREDVLQMKWQYEGPTPVGFIGTTAAIIAGSAIAAGGSIASSVIASKGAKAAAETQAESAREARDLYEPFRKEGAEAFSSLGDLMGPGGELRKTWNKDFVSPTADELTLDPGYQFRLEEGNKAIERSASARGGLTSGRTMKEMTRFSQRLAGEEYDDAWKRKLTEYSLAYNEFQNDQENLYRRLMGVSEIGVRGAGGAADATNLAGAARASGQVGSANAWSSGIQGMSGNIGEAILLSSLLGKDKDQG